MFFLKLHRFVRIIIYCFIVFVSMNFTTLYASTEKISVNGITRIMHPAFKAGQYSYSTRKPFNSDNTKIVMYETPVAYDVPGRTWSLISGRKHVVGDIEKLKSISDESNFSLWLTNYLSNTIPIPSPGSVNRGDTAMWSIHPGEENTLFVLYKSGNDGILRKFDINNMASTSNALGSVTLTNGGYGVIVGWTRTGSPRKLLVLDNQDSSTGWYIDTINMTSTPYTAPTQCTQEQRNLPTLSHGHSSTSPSGRYKVDYWDGGDYRTDQWGYYKHDSYSTVTDRSATSCNRYDIRVYDTPAIEGETDTRRFRYAEWSYSEDWFLATDLGGGPFGSSAHIDNWGIWKVDFIPGQQSPTLSRELLFTTNTGGWRSGEANWSNHPFPFISSDATYIMFTSTDNKFSYEDRDYSNGNWGLEGIFIADISLSSGSQTCTSFTYSDWGACQSNNTQTRTITSSSPSGCTGGTPLLTQSCTYSSAPALTILKTTSAPTIDGNLTEYNNANSISFSPASGGNTVTVKPLWTSEALYLGINVTDTQLNASITNRDGGVWNEDSLEWFIDTYYDGGGSSNPDSDFMRVDDYHGIVSILNTKYDSQGTTSGTPLSSWNGTWQSAVKLSGTANTNTDTDSGYTLEIKIPWTSIGYSTAPSSDALAGMSFAVNDKDSGGTYSKMWLSTAGANPNASNWQKVLLSGSLATLDVTPPAPPGALMIR